MLRNLEQLDFQILSWKTDGSGSDDSIIEILQAGAEQSSFDEVEYREEEPPSVIAAIDLALTDNFLSAVAIFLLALERGESSLVQRAITMLKSGLEICRELNLIPQWWSHRIGVHLIELNLGRPASTCNFLKDPMAAIVQSGEGCDACLSRCFIAVGKRKLICGLPRLMRQRAQLIKVTTW